MKTIKEHVNILLKYWKEYYTTGGFEDIFSLKKEMIKHGICPRCGTKSRGWSSVTGHFPCWECGFNITEDEIYRIEEGQKGVLKYKLRRKPPKGFIPFSRG
jgi:hypothetical protein